jgi:hypothetical protein
MTKLGTAAAAAAIVLSARGTVRAAQCVPNTTIAVTVPTAPSNAIISAPFSGPSGCLTLDGDPSQIVSGDFDFDGKPDLAVGLDVAKNAGCAAASPGGFVVLQQGAGSPAAFSTFPAAVGGVFSTSFGAPAQTRGLALGRFEAADPHPEIAQGVPVTTDVGIYTNGFAGHYNFVLAEPIIFPVVNGTPGGCLQAGTFFQSEDLIDCVSIGIPPAPAVVGPPLVMLNENAATPPLVSTKTYGANGAIAITHAPLSGGASPFVPGTQLTDAAYVDGTSANVYLMLNSGTLDAANNVNFALRTIALTSGLFPQAIVSGDFNLDGHFDLVILSPQAPQGMFLQLLSGTGGGAFIQGPAVLIPNSACGLPTQMVAADLNLDGFLDLALTTNCAIYALAGTGASFVESVYLPVAAGVGAADALTVADLDGNGFPDLAAVRHIGPPAGVHIYYNTSPCPQPPPTPAAPKSSIGLLAASLLALGAMAAGRTRRWARPGRHA